MKKLTLGSLCAFSVLASSCKTVDKQNSEGKFGGGEHLMIGDEGYRQAMGKGKGEKLDSIPRADGDVAFTYGEIVALSGDFYANAAMLDNDRKSTGFIDEHNPLSDYNNVKAVIVEFREEGFEAEEQKSDPTKKMGDRNFPFFRSFGMEYLELAVCNTDHFGWHNMKRYVHEHGEAIKLAQLAFEARKKREQKEADAQAKGETLLKDHKEEKELYRQAILRNGFADHFLTDGFASGHVRIPRAQGIASRKVKCEGSAKASKEEAPSGESDNGRLIGALVKIQHDNDHTYETHGGLKVVNAKGHKWKARADGELYKDSNSDDSAVRYAVNAVKLSVQELRIAYETGKAPSGLYAATELVPFIDPTEDTFVETFSPKLTDKELQKMIIDPESSLYDRTINKLKNSVVRLTPATVRAYFAETPKLMEQFRRDVANDVDTDPELSKRLAPAYINGYLNVQ